MTYVIVHWDESGNRWILHNEAGETVAGPWDDRPEPKTIYTEMGSDLIQKQGVPDAIGAAVASDYRYIRESSDTPLPWK